MIVRRRPKLWLAALLLPVLGGLAVIALGGRASSSSTVAPSARPAATAFANAYVAFLNGRLAASALPDSTAYARALAASGGRVPAAYQGKLVLRRVAFSGVLGARQASAMVIASIGARTPQAAFSLVYTGGRWAVSALVPPDFDTLIPPPSAPAPVPSTARAAAKAFALAYVDYRTGARSRPPAGLPTIESQIAAHQDPLAHSAHTRSAARLVSLAMLAEGQSVPVSAVVRAGGRRLTFTFLLQRAGNGWQAWQFPVSGQ